MKAPASSPRSLALYDWRQSFFPVNDKQISLSFLTDTSSSRGCGKRGNPAGCAGFPREVGREGKPVVGFPRFPRTGFFHSSAAAAFCVFVVAKKLIVN